MGGASRVIRLSVSTLEITTSRDMICKGKEEYKFVKQKDERRPLSSVCRLIARKRVGSAQTKKNKKKVGPLLHAFDEARRWSLYTRVRHSDRQVFYAAQW